MYKCIGIVIKTKDIGEFDRLVTIYSREFGKLVLKAKSVRKNGAKLTGHLDLFSCGHFMIAPGRSIDIITNVDSVVYFSNIRDDLKMSLTAMYLADALDKFVVGPEKDENIWDLFFASLNGIDRGEDETVVVKKFESGFAQYLGYEGTDFKEMAEQLGEKIPRKRLDKIISL